MSGRKQLSLLGWRGLLRMVLSLSLLSMSQTGMAAPENITDAEMKLIPAYCRDAQTFGYGDATHNTSPRAGHWVALMGKTFWAIHHYCWAQISMSRSRRAGIPAYVRRGLWESARGDYRYVIANSTPDFILLPEIYTRIGDVELLLNNVVAADEAFGQARKAKPEYWPSYSHWAEFLMKNGRRPEAMKMVTAGLEQAPGTKALLEQFQLLGGNPSNLPPPKEKQAQPSDPKAENDERAVSRDPATTIGNDDQKQ
jgi:hypothetical protein